MKRKKNNTPTKIGMKRENNPDINKIISKFLGFNFVSTTKAAFKKVSAAVLKFLGGDEYNLDFFITLILLRSNSFKTNLSVFNLLPNLELEFDPIPKA